MILVGLSLVGAALVYFPAATSAAMCICCFVVLGVGFSMLRGPIVKLASENTLPQYARICCVILSTSYYVGPFIAGILTLFFKWKTVFVISGILAVIIAVVSFSVISLYEKAGLVVPVKIEKKGRYYDGFRSVFKLPNFCVYVVISAVLEVSGTAITFWLPTYVNEYLGFASNVSGIIFSIISLINSFGTFLCLILFKKFGENDMLMLRVMFSLSAVFFVGMCFIHITWINLLLLLFALLANCCASGVMWSIYIPSLAKSGRVSGANGILDCAGYGGAAIATTVFAGTMEKLGWTGTILLWGATALIGAIVTIFGKIV